MQLGELTDHNQAIHEARKDFKKFRALLRLVKGQIKHTVLAEHQRAIRDAGRLLAEARDSSVLLETMALLGEQQSHLPKEVVYGAILSHLQEEHHTIIKRLLGESTIATVILVARERQEAVADWKLRIKTYKPLYKGMEQSYTAGRKALALAAAEPTSENLHNWRKRVKDLYYQLGFFESFWSNTTREFSEDLGHLADLLGEEHDLAVLRHTLELAPELAIEQDSSQFLFDLIAQRREALQAEIWILGVHLYKAKPEKFIMRITGKWRYGNQRKKVAKHSANRDD